MGSEVCVGDWRGFGACRDGLGGFLGVGRDDLGGWLDGWQCSGGRQALGKPTEASFSHRQPERRSGLHPATQATLMLEQTDTWCHRHSVSQTDSLSDIQTCCS